MPEYRTPMKERMRASERWRQRYREDPEFRLKCVNWRRKAAGRPLLTDLPPVGEVKRQWASTRPRDGKGRFIQDQADA